MKIAEAFDVPDELARLKHAFEETRHADEEWCPMGVVHTPAGIGPVLLPLPSTDLVAGMLGSVVMEMKATAALLAQDAWMNTMRPGSDEEYLRPSQDPLTSEIFVVMFMTAEAVEVHVSPYIVENGRVVWRENEAEQLNDPWARAAFPVQEALRRVS